MSKDRTDYPFSVDRDELAKEMEEQINKFYNFCFGTSMLALWRRSYNQYYAGYYTGGSIRVAGEQGELRDFSVNDYRNLLQHILVLTTANPPSWDAKSVNSDYAGLSKTIPMNLLLEYYHRFGGMREASDRATEHTCVYGDGYIHVYWDKDRGEKQITSPVLPDGMEIPEGLTAGEVLAATGKQNTEMSGDLVYDAKAPIDIIYDTSIRNFNDRKWIIDRSFRNKYLLAAQWPDYADTILSLSYKPDLYRDIDEVFSGRYGMDQDTIPFYTLYHEQCELMPDGRMAIMIGDEIVLDEPMPYKQIPIVRVTAAYIDRTCMGYTPGFDLLAIQKAKDVLHSTIITNQSTYGVQNILIPKDANISFDAMMGGMNTIKYDNILTQGAKPEALSLVSTKPEIFNYLETLGGAAQMIAGVSAVNRGEVPTGVKAGNALALLASQAIQFNSGLQKTYVNMYEKVGQITIEILKKHLTKRREYAIVGKIPGQYSTSLSGEELPAVVSIQVDIGNALTRTASGRATIADNLLERGMIKDPMTYMLFLQTGKIEPMMEGESAVLLTIRKENEDLMQGKACPVYWTDNHPKHIQEHMNMLSTPDVRNNPDIANVVLAHVSEQIAMWESTDPIKLQAIGIPPLIAPLPPPDVGASPGGEIPPPPQDVPLPTPSMPNNPLTGEEYDDVTGGGVVSI